MKPSMAGIHLYAQVLIGSKQCCFQKTKPTQPSVCELRRSWLITNILAYGSTKVSSYFFFIYYSLLFIHVLIIVSISKFYLSLNRSWIRMIRKSSLNFFMCWDYNIIIFIPVAFFYIIV